MVILKSLQRGAATALATKSMLLGTFTVRANDLTATWLSIDTGMLRKVLTGTARSCAESSNGTCTVTWQVSLKLLPSVVVAVISVWPAPMAKTMPLLVTMATSSSLDCHSSTVEPVLSGSIVAVRRKLPPMSNSTESGATEMELALRGSTVITLVALKLVPSMVVAVICAWPAATPVTMPFSSTVAIVSSLEDQFAV